MRPISLRFYSLGQNKTGESGERAAAAIWTSGNSRVAAREHSAFEFMRCHRLGKQVALQQVEAQIADGKEIGLRLYALGNRSRPGIARDCDDLRAMSLLDAVVGAAVNELAGYFHLDNREFSPSGECRTQRVHIVDRYANVTRSELGGDPLNQRQLIDEVDAIDPDQKAILPHFVRKVFHHAVNEVHVLQREQRQTDRNLDLVVGGGELHRIRE